MTCYSGAGIRSAGGQISSPVVGSVSTDEIRCPFRTGSTTTLQKRTSGKRKLDSRGCPARFLGEALVNAEPSVWLRLARRAPQHTGLAAALWRELFLVEGMKKYRAAHRPSLAAPHNPARKKDKRLRKGERERKKNLPVGSGVGGRVPFTINFGDREQWDSKRFIDGCGACGSTLVAHC